MELSVRQTNQLYCVKTLSYTVMLLNCPSATAFPFDWKRRISHHGNNGSRKWRSQDFIRGERKGGGRSYRKRTLCGVGEGQVEEGRLVNITGCD